MDSQPPAMHHHLRNYLTGEISLNDLKERLIEATWDGPNAESSADRQIACDIELVLAEASSGYLTSEDMRSDLQALLERAALAASA